MPAGRRGRCAQSAHAPMELGFPIVPVRRDTLPIATLKLLTKMLRRLASRPRYFPEQFQVLFRMARVIPLPKGGSTPDSLKLRPIVIPETQRKLTALASRGVSGSGRAIS